MKRLILVLGALCAFGLVSVAMAGDYHSGTELICSDCHVAHWSQQHGYSTTNTYVGDIGGAGPHDALLRNEVNDLCLSCHNDNSYGPDVFGANTGKYSGTLRSAGGLNAAPGHLTNEAGYDDIDGHTLWSMDMPPGNTGAPNPYVPRTDGLECIDCHSQHGQNTFQFRNLQYSTSATSKFQSDSLTYAVATNVLTKDVFEKVGVKHYAQDDIAFNEPVTTKSAYAKWCQACHYVFHGAGGSANMGSVSGGVLTAGGVPWKRHPTSDVNIGHTGSSTRNSSLPQYNSHTNRVRVMDSQGLWDGTVADNTVTPSCFSCHKSHGNQNGFGLIFMNGTGTVTEEGDGGVYKDLCRQCHIQGA
jgi:hypothetical protein